MNLVGFGCRAVSLALTAFVLGGCAPGYGVAPLVPERVAAARDAGLTVFAMLEPRLPGGRVPPYRGQLGPARLQTGDCAARFAHPGLAARCEALRALVVHAETRAQGLAGGPVLGAARALLAEVSGGLAEQALAELERVPTDGDVAAVRLAQALRADAGALYRVARAAFESELRQAENAFVAGLDDALLSVAGRRPPDGMADRADFERSMGLAAGLLVREAPLPPATTLYGQMIQDGPPVEVASLREAVARSIAAADAFDSATAEWRVLSEALHAYDDLLRRASVMSGSSLVGPPATGVPFHLFQSLSRFGRTAS